MNLLNEGRSLYTQECIDLCEQIVGCIERLTRSPSAMLTTLLLAFVLLIDDLIMFIE